MQLYQPKNLKRIALDLEDIESNPIIKLAFTYDIISNTGTYPPSEK
jgi:hypothetical protein